VANLGSKLAKITQSTMFTLATIANGTTAKWWQTHPVLQCRSMANDNSYLYLYMLCCDRLSAV